MVLVLRLRVRSGARGRALPPRTPALGGCRQPPNNPRREGLAPPTVAGKCADDPRSVWWALAHPHALDRRGARAAAHLGPDPAAAVQERVDALLKRHDVAAWLQVTVSETASVQRRSGRNGRPSAATPVAEVTTYQVAWSSQRTDAALQEAHTLAGWRVAVTNSTSEEVSLVQATALYREQWTVAHGFHRGKGGPLPALPLFLPINWRIRGLMLLLRIAVQVLALLEWQARRTLATEQASSAGAVTRNAGPLSGHVAYARCCDASVITENAKLIAALSKGQY